ncbi:MAG: DUF5305 family protein [Halodesulfurarchaeum sp.]
MVDDRTRLRLRSLVDSWDGLLVGVLVVAVLIGAWGTYGAHVDPGTEESVTSVDVWDLDGEFEHAATVTQPNPVFENGTVIENRSAYFERLSPVLNGTYRLEYRAGTDSTASVRVEPRLVLENSDEDGVYWRNVTTLGATTASLAPGEDRSRSVAVNVTALDQRAERITDAVGTTPGETTMALSFAVTAETSLDTDQPELEYTARVPITTDGDVYRVGDLDEPDTTITREVVRTSPARPGPLLGIGSPLLLIVSLSLLALLLGGRRARWFELSSLERRRLSFLTERREFDEWIVRASLPDAVREREAAEAKSLTDLVDFAIDSGVSVIEDADAGEYYAVAAEQVLRYRVPPGVSIPGSDERDTE